MKHPHRWSPRLAPLALLIAAALAQAQRNDPPPPPPSSIVVDGSTLGTQPFALQGPVYAIPQSLGRLSGANLFHSFQRFGLAAGESAQFSTQTPGIANLISRVTGGEASSILGRISLQAAAGAPAFFLINPAGVVFGAGASIDVPGAFHASTAPRLRFAGGEQLDTGSADSSFSAAAPEAFGFLGGARAAALQTQGSAQLLGAAGQLLSFSAGDLLLAGERISANGGLRLAAAGAAAAEVPLLGALPASLDGVVSLSQAARVGVVATDAQPAGELTVQAGDLMLTGAAALVSQTRPDSSGAGGALSIRLGRDLLMNGESHIDTVATGGGAGGALSIQARHATLWGGAYVQTLSLGSGAGGALDLLLHGTLDLSDGAGLYGGSFGPGAAGALRAQAASIWLSQGGYAETTHTADGAGGALSLIASGDLLLSDGARVLNLVDGSGAGGDTLLRAGGQLSVTGDSRVTQTAAGTGASGALRLEATDLLLLSSRVTHNSAFNGGATGATELRASRLLLADASDVLATTESGRTGDFLLQAADILLTNGSLVLNSAQGTGAQAGRVRLLAELSLELSDSGVNNAGLLGGAAGDVLLQGRSLRLGEGSRVSSVASGEDSQAGNLWLRGLDSLLIEGGSFVSADTRGRFKAGDIRLEAPSLRVLDSSVSSVALEGSSGAGGTVQLLAGGLLDVQGAALSSATAGSGAAGVLDLSGEDVRIGSGSLINSGIEVPGSGAGGLIRIAARRDLSVQGPNTSLTSGGFSGASPAGSLQLSAGRDLLVEGGARLGSFTVTAGRAGALDLQAGRDLTVRGASQISSFTTSTGDAGRLLLAAGRELLLTESAELSTNTLGDGAGGSITLRAPVLRVEGDARVSSSTIGGGGLGDAGSVVLQADNRLLLARANVNSLTGSAGRAGSLQLSAPEIVIDDQSQLLASVFQGARGAGGAVRVQAGQSLTVRGGSRIDSSSFGGGDAGDVLLSSGGGLDLLGQSLLSSFTTGAARAGTVQLQAAGRLQLAGGSHVEASTTGSGAAGSLRLQGGEVLIDGASLNSSTLGSGAAGQIDVTAQQGLLMRNRATVTAVAGQDSGGQTGNVNLMAGTVLRLEDRSQASTANGATVRDPAALTPTVLSLMAPVIELDAAIVNATATGNANASRILIKAGDSLDLKNSNVNTDANRGNGGPVRVQAGRGIRLKDSAVTTSVSGDPGGNGGDIDVQTELLFLDNGFIQANTVAQGASGGDVRIEVGAVVAAGNRLMVGGAQPLRFNAEGPRVNVIQAAAPDGVAGNVAVSGQIDLAGSLALLERQLFDPGGLGRSPCERSGSSLASSGRGGLPGAAPAAARPAAAETVQALAATAASAASAGSCR